MQSKSEIVERYFPPGFTASVIDIPPEGASYQQVMAQWDAADDLFKTLTYSLMEDMRSLGALSPCMTISERKISEYEAWNAFVEGGMLDPMQRFDVSLTMAFNAPMAAVSSTIIQGRTRTDAGQRVKDDDITSAAGWKEIISACDNAIHEVMVSGNADRCLDRFDLRCPMTGALVTPDRSDLYAPVLMSFDVKAGKGLPLRDFKAPKIIQHIVMPMPSGILVLTDRLTPPGFKEGMKALDTSGYNSINHAAGLDHRTKQHFTKAGIAMVQVGNTSPHAFVEGDIIRMGTVYEDDDHFWNDDGTQKDIAIPQASWGVTTDVWANTFADRLCIIDVMMASGQFPDRHAADISLTEYCTELGDEVVIRDIGTDDLHIYMPAGHFDHQDGTLPAIFDEIEMAAWRTDKYILSRHSLAVNSDYVADMDWSVPMRQVEPALSTVPEP